MSQKYGARGLLFDLGYTLLDEVRFDREAGTERVLELAHNPRGLSVADVCELVAALDADLDPRRKSSWIEVSPLSVHRLVYEPHGIRFERPFEEIEREFWRASTSFVPTPGITGLLEWLGSTGLPLGVVSNSTFTSGTLAWQLEQHGLRDHFRFVMSSGDYVVRKPHPEIFRAAATKLGTAPSDTWFVGDSLEYDMVGAQSAGQVGVWYNPNGLPCGEVRPAFEVRTWPELPEILTP